MNFSTPSAAVVASEASVPRISGTTAVYLIPGDPVAQVRAPELFNRIFARLGIDAVLVPVRVKPADIATFVRTAFLADNVRGMFVAIPHKAPLSELVDICSREGQAAGAINAIRRNDDGRLEGGLFDGAGFVGALQWEGLSHAGKRVLVLGAGGGAAAIAAALAATVPPAGEIALYDPVPGKAEAIAERLRKHFDCRAFAAAGNDPSGYDLVVNASPLGLQANDPVPCDVARLDTHAAVVDILMKNQPTPLVRATRARGLPAFAGFEMLIQQAPHYLEFFGHVEAARAVRTNGRFLREMIYPVELAGEIRD